MQIRIVYPPGDDQVDCRGGDIAYVQHGQASAVSHSMAMLSLKSGGPFRVVF